MPVPTYLYHASPEENLGSIRQNGLMPRSGAPAYLCMSAVESGAICLKSKASDLVFRVEYSGLDQTKWKEIGAGKKEWRGTETIPANKLQYRRFLGSPEQKTWRAV